MFELLIPEVNTVGSSNYLRRVFCNNRCKNEFNRNKKTGKIEQSCQICKSIFFCYPSNLTKSLYCSLPCKNFGIANKRKKSIKVPCPQCNILFEKQPTARYPLYCSRKCQIQDSHIIKFCVTCTKPFNVKKSDAHIQRCSRKCQFIDQSNGKIKIHLNGRTGYRIDLGMKDYFKSALEADFARFLKYFGIEYFYENKTFLTEKGAYTPDFFLPEFNLFVELKGVENNGKPFANMMTKNLSKHQSVLEQAYKIITITQKEFTTGLKSANIWPTIPNLEQRNYKKTQGLVVTHENQTNQQSKFTITDQSD